MGKSFYGSLQCAGGNVQYAGDFAFTAQHFEQNRFSLAVIFQDVYKRQEYDGVGNEIPHATESYIPSEPGCDIYLTLDETIQYIIERELKKVVQEQDAGNATAIVMDVKTGALLGMANYPDYNLNDYASVDSSLWSNFAVNGLYEPG